MGKDKKKSKVGFQFTALQKRIKLLEAKNLVLEAKNKELSAQVRKDWRDMAATESEPAIYPEDLVYPKKPWWKLF